jgi:hypothetical protein
MDYGGFGDGIVYGKLADRLQAERHDMKERSERLEDKQEKRQAGEDQCPDRRPTASSKGFHYIFWRISQKPGMFLEVYRRCHE